MTEIEDLPFDTEPTAGNDTPAAFDALFPPGKEADKPVALSTSESLSLEREKAPNEILLFRRGKFLRAYNRSAYLVSSLFRSEYKILRDRVRKGDPYLYLGFPVGKLDEVFSDGCKVDDGERYVSVSFSETLLKEIPSYEKWMNEVKAIDRKETELPPDPIQLTSGTMHIGNAYDIAVRLVTYHMEAHTIMENLQFLSELISSVEYRN